MAGIGILGGVGLGGLFVAAAPAVVPAAAPVELLAVVGGPFVVAGVVLVLVVLAPFEELVVAVVVE